MACPPWSAPAARPRASRTASGSASTVAAASSRSCSRQPRVQRRSNYVANAIIGWFEDVGLGQRAEVGGKGGSLGELTRAGIAVPPGFVIRTAAFEQFMQALESAAPVRARVAALRAGDLEAIRAVSAELR